MKTISIAKDFSEFPAGRYRNQGPATGEAFREDFLKLALQEHSKVYVNLDGTEGYGSSFLEEAFGGLVRKNYFTKDILEEKLVIEAKQSEFKHFVLLAWEYIKKAKVED